MSAQSGGVAGDSGAGAAAAAGDDALRTLLGLARRRRVTRSFRPGALQRSELEALVEAAWWSPSGSNRRPVKFVVVEEPRRLRQVLCVSPGILGEPAALLVLCLDWAKAPHLEIDDPRTTHSLHVDAGAAMENVLLAAEALGIGACPVMSFHRESVRRLLRLADDWTPLIIVVLGRPADERRAPKEVVVDDRIKAAAVWIQGDDASAGATPAPREVTPETLREALLELMVYLGAAARGNVDESGNYGRLRLLEGVQRGVRTLERFGLADDELRAFDRELTTQAMTILKDPERARGAADDVLALLTSRLA
jgi:nitroreductase